MLKGLREITWHQDYLPGIETTWHRDFSHGNQTTLQHASNVVKTLYSQSQKVDIFYRGIDVCL